MRLDAGSRPDLNISLNFDERSNKAIIADFAAIQIDGINNSDVGSKLNVDNPDFLKLNQSEPFDLTKYKIYVFFIKNPRSSRRVLMIVPV